MVKTSEFKVLPGCPIPNETHEKHDEMLRRMGERLAIAEKKGIVSDVSLSVAKGEYEELLKSFKASKDRTTRILAERLFDVERQNEKLREALRVRQ